VRFHLIGRCSKEWSRDAQRAESSAESKQVELRLAVNALICLNGKTRIGHTTGKAAARHIRKARVDRVSVRRRHAVRESPVGFQRARLQF
jgi:hypothetical protein